MRNDTRKYLNQEAKYCNEIWKELNKDNQLEHFHICDFQLMAMLNRFKKSYKKYEKEWNKKCNEYLASIGHKQDECMECCDYCPHMRYLTLSEDNYFLNIASLGIDRFLFDEEK